MGLECKFPRCRAEIGLYQGIFYIYIYNIFVDPLTKELNNDIHFE